MKKVLLLFVFIVCSVEAYPQYFFEPINNTTYSLYQSDLYTKDSKVHTSIRPFKRSEIQSYYNRDSINTALIPSSKFSKTWFGRKLFSENLIKVDKGDFYLTIDPVVDFKYGYSEEEGETNQPYTNTRGVLMQGNIGKKFSFSTMVLENQSLFPNYVTRFINQNAVVPGQGKARGFKESGSKDYSMAWGTISYNASEYFNFEFGHGKNFIGDGYRSLLLSDAGFSYPYLKITTSVWNIKYMNIFAEMQDIRPGVEANDDVLNVKKFTTMHYLSWKVNKRLSLGFFEAIVWQDTTGTRGFDVNYLNPIIFYRPVEFSLGSPDNAVLGMNLSYKLTDNTSFYGQLVLDEFILSELRAQDGYWANKYGWQLGAKHFNTFGIDGLDLQSEFNFARPYLYTHRTDEQNYGHFNQSLAHPFGANFYESVSFIRYNHRRWNFEAEFLFAVTGRDSAGTNFGGDIYQSSDTRESSSGNFVGNGVKTNLTFLSLTASYLLNPLTNLRLEAGVSYRHLSPETEVDNLQDRSTTFITFGLSTNILNKYYDF